METFTQPRLTGYRQLSEAEALAKWENKAWTVVYDGDSDYPRLVCTACATDGGTFGWVGKE